MMHKHTLQSKHDRKLQMKCWRCVQLTASLTGVRLSSDGWQKQGLCFSVNDLSQCASDPRICTRHEEHSHTHHICLIELLHHSPDWAINESTGTRSGISIINRNTYRSSQSGAVKNLSWAVESRLTLQDTHTQNINIPNTSQNTHTFPTNPISYYSIMYWIYTYYLFNLQVGTNTSYLRASAFTPYEEYGLDHQAWMLFYFIPWQKQASLNFFKIVKHHLIWRYTVVMWLKNFSLVWCFHLMSEVH